MEKAIFFDTGPIISIVMSRMSWILPELKKKYGGKFYITPAVKRELVERPLNIKRFEFEALQTLKLINDGIFEVYEKIPKQKIVQLTSLANNSFTINNKNVDIVQSGEMESVAAALDLGAEAVVVDERTTRLLVEGSTELEKMLSRKFQKEVVADHQKLTQVFKLLDGLKIIRSVELVAVAYRMSLFDSYQPPQKDGKEVLVDSVLWAMKFNGCAVSEDEIGDLKTVLLSGK